MVECETRDVSPALSACALFLLAAFAVGCGKAAEFPRAAEPADSPPTRARATGVVAPVGEMPEGMVFVPAAGLLAVGLRNPSQLAFVDPRTLAVKRRVALPAPPRHLALSPSGTAVVVPAEAANAVLEVSSRRGVVATTTVGNHPHDAASAAGSVFVADEHSDQVSVLRGGRDVATLSAPVQPGGIAAAGNRYVALIAVAERVLQVYDAHALKPLGATSAGIGPTHIVGYGNDAFVADTQGDLVREYRIGPEPRQVATAPASGAPYGLAVDVRRQRLWVTLTASNRLAEYDIAAERPRRVATYTTVRQPNSVEVDPRSGNVFVAGNAGGQIERISPREERR